MRSVLVALVVLVSATAHAQSKIALTAIDGDDGDLREAVAEALDGKELSVISAKETNRAVDRLKIELPDVNEKQARKLAGELEADAVVAGWLDGNEGKSKLLKFRLFVGGKKVKGFSVQFSNARSRKFKEALHEKMVEKVSTGAVVAEADPEPRKGKQTAKVDDDEPKKKRKKKKKGKRTLKKQKADGEPDEEDERLEKETATAEEDEVDEDEVDEESLGIKLKQSAHTANRAAVRIDVGSSVTTRQLTFTFTPELAADDLQPQPFRPGPVAGARVEGEINPIAFFSPDSYASGLGIAFEFDQVLSSRVQTTLEPGSIGKVKQQHYLLGARYRLTLNDTPTAPSISAGFGYGRRSFVVVSGLMDREALDLPDTDYSYLAPQLGFRIPIGRNFALVSMNEAMLVRDAGRISDSDQYGRAKVFGFETQTGFDIVIKNRIAIRLVAEYTQIGFTFTGGGDKARNRDLQPETIDIGGALDRSIGGVGTLAVLY